MLTKYKGLRRSTRMTCAWECCRAPRRVGVGPVTSADKSRSKHFNYRRESKQTPEGEREARRPHWAGVQTLAPTRLCDLGKFLHLLNLLICKVHVIITLITGLCGPNLSKEIKNFRQCLHTADGQWMFQQRWYLQQEKYTIQREDRMRYINFAVKA